MLIYPNQVQKRKLLWSNKEKSAAVAEAAKWSGARFAQDNDGKQVSKFMRLMGIKEPGELGICQMMLIHDLLKLLVKVEQCWVVN